MVPALRGALLSFVEDFIKGFIPGALIWHVLLSLLIMQGSGDGFNAQTNRAASTWFDKNIIMDFLQYPMETSSHVGADAFFCTLGHQSSFLLMLRDRLDCDLAVLTAAASAGLATWLMYWSSICLLTMVSDWQIFASVRKKWSIVENGVLTNLIQSMEATTGTESTVNAGQQVGRRVFYLPSRKEQLAGPSFVSCLPNAFFNTTLYCILVSIVVFQCSPKRLHEDGMNADRYLPEAAPFLCRTVTNLVVMTLFWDVSMYLSHRFVFHELFPSLHELHHRVKGALPISCMYLHPLDTIGEFVLPDTIGMVVIAAVTGSCNWASCMIWLVCTAWDNVMSHTGFQIPGFVSGGVNHWLHHAKYNCNYSAYFLDPFFDTSAKASIVLRDASMASAMVNRSFPVQKTAKSRC